MPDSIRYTLCSEGPADQVLKHHIEWALGRLTTLPFAGDWADPTIFDNQARDVATRAAQAVAYYPCNLLFVHRDADRDGYDIRRAEVITGLRQAGIAVASVAVVPVRMTEAWLLCSESAVRQAAGRPMGVQTLPLPSVQRVEADSSPKKTFEQCLCVASERSGRRLEQFRRELPALRHRVAELIEDFEPLLAAPSFRRFYDELKVTLERAGLRGA